MPLLRASLAMSLDGYIADADGGVEWLNDYWSKEFDFGRFMASIGAVVIGRATYDWMVAHKGGQHTGGRTIVLTRRPLRDPPPGFEAFAGDVRELAARLCAELSAPGPEQGKDVWLMGGGESLRALHAADVVDRWEISVVPVLLGAGIPLFPRHGDGLSRLRLVHSQPYANGVVALHYARAGEGGDAAAAAGDDAEMAGGETPPALAERRSMTKAKAKRSTRAQPQPQPKTQPKP